MFSLSDPRYFSPPTPVESWQSRPRGFLAFAGRHEVAISAVADAVFRVEMRIRGSAEHSSYAVLPQDTEAIHSQVVETEQNLALVLRGATLSLNKASLAIEIRRADGSLVASSPSDREHPPISFLNDEFIIRRRAESEDLILGLGEKTGPLNRKGRKYMLWNTDVLNPNTIGELPSTLHSDDPRRDPTSTQFDPYYISIPFYHSVDAEGRAAGFFIDNVFGAEYDFENPEETKVHFAGGRYVEYFFVGPEIKDVLKDYTALTGRMEPPPIWTLGYHHCRWHPYSQEDVLAKAAKYRSSQIPCDSIWLDIDHMDGYRVFTWNPTTFPEPKKMIGELDREGFRVITIVDPGVKVEPGWHLFDSGLESDVFCLTEGGNLYQGQVWPGKTAFPDFATEAARDWWGKLNAQHIELGLAGIWNDMNEPATGDIAADAMRFDGGRLPHGSLHNVYALLMAMATVEGLRGARPNQRPFVLSRAGSAGIQRYAANWLGDNMSRWDHLALSMPMTLGLGLSGQPFVGADIGGFAENCTGELLARWFQAAALSPFCRLHNATGNRDQSPWSFGPEIERICRESIELRYRLLPYIYTAFVESSRTGVPVMRPMVMNWPTIPGMREVSDQYLLGPDLLVAPISEANRDVRRIVLPPAGWVNWWSDEQVEHESIEVEAPLDRIPLFARAGSIIPMWPEAPASTHSYSPMTIELHLFVPERDGTYTSTLSEDDGATLGYLQGERLDTEFTVHRQGSRLSVTAQTTGRPYPGHARRAFTLVLRGCGPRTEFHLDASESSLFWEHNLCAEAAETRVRHLDLI